MIKIKFKKRNRKRKFNDRVKSVRHFLFTEIWHIQLDDGDRSRKNFWIRSLRVILLAIRGFKEDNVALRASALTFYTTIAIVPVFAMFFGIAKGFGLEKNLDEFLYDKFQGQEEVMRWIMSFSSSLLEKTVGGLMAGVGLVILMWSVLRVFTSIEISFNAIWHLEKGRKLTRKFSDYFSVMLIAPLLLIASSSANVYLATMLNTITKQYAILGYVEPVIILLLKVVPYFLVGILFTLIYMVMPNTKVHFKAALVAGVLAGVAFELVQWGYIYFQVGVSRYNAIYGSFAALPLFMVWQQISWIIVLVGAEISFAIQNAHLYEYEYEIENVSHSDKRNLSVLLMSCIVKQHISGGVPYTSETIAEELNLPIRLVRTLLGSLVHGNLLVETYTDDPKSRGFVPAITEDAITICTIYDMIDRQGVDNAIKPKSAAYSAIKTVSNKMEELSINSNLNVKVRDFS